MFHLVTPLPALLDYSFYAPLLLRLTLGVYILAIGFSAHRKNSPDSPDLHVEMSPLQILFSGLFILAGLSLIVGIFVQISAIIVVILMLITISDKTSRLTHELGRAELSLLLIIALSLIVTGAGPFAIDLPL